mmetsp:Transcript_5665/g.19818  ORF Transcript_5665/g.19818 Transcript_5665/m.19818 type:complete len:256 (-) Transcript_5665:2-769(-)
MCSQMEHSEFHAVPIGHVFDADFPGAHFVAQLVPESHELFPGEGHGSSLSAVDPEQVSATISMHHAVQQMGGTFQVGVFAGVRPAEWTGPGRQGDRPSTCRAQFSRPCDVLRVTFLFHAHHEVHALGTHGMMAPSRQPTRVAVDPVGLDHVFHEHAHQVSRRFLLLPFARSDSQRLVLSVLPRRRARVFPRPWWSVSCLHASHRPRLHAIRRFGEVFRRTVSLQKPLHAIQEPVSSLFHRRDDDVRRVGMRHVRW